MPEPVDIAPPEVRLYGEENGIPHIKLTEKQKAEIAQITYSIVEVDENIRTNAVPDIIDTLENGNPLNRLIADPDGTVTGYLACIDIGADEAYVSYVGTTRKTGVNLLREVPAFLEFASSQGYSKISFDGWNSRFNRALEHFGFEKKGASNVGPHNVGYYEVELGPTPWQQCETLIDSFPPDERGAKIEKIEEAYDILTTKLEAKGIELNKVQLGNLRLKMARWFQRNDEADLATVFDALVETPRFLDIDRGSIQKLLEVHEVKTLEKIAEARKRIAERTEEDGFSPFENLFETDSGNYYMARLLNMPHLEAESKFMDHCVGRSDSYVNRLKDGEIEILSFRHAPSITNGTWLEGDYPLITVEYNLKTKTIEQIKKASDGLLRNDDEYFQEFIEALSRLRTTRTDKGDLRNFKRINTDDTAMIVVTPGKLLTQLGEITLDEFSPEAGDFVLRSGDMDINPNTSKEKVVKLLRASEGLEVKPEQIALSVEQITPDTVVYIGNLEQGFFAKMPDRLTYIFTNYPEHRIEISRNSVEVGNKTAAIYLEELEQRGIGVDWDAIQMMNSSLFASPKQEKINLVKLKVRDLGIRAFLAATQHVYKTAQYLGLELCPPEVGPALRLKYGRQHAQNMVNVAMEPFAPNEYIFGLWRGDQGKALTTSYAAKGITWAGEEEFVFRLPERS